MELTQVLLSPVVTEKSNSKQAKHVFTFLVNRMANKIEIGKAVEKAYGVDVKKVAIIPVRAKQRLAGRGKFITKRPAAKKAFVTIDAKQTLDVNKFSKK